jgi:hypothetical protein
MMMITTHKNFKKKMASKMKHRQRHNAMLNDGVPFENVLLLTSRDCLDVVEGLSSGSINKSTRVISVENNKALQPAIEKNLDRLIPGQWDLQMKNIEKVDLEEERLDGLFLDLCGYLKPEHSVWLHNNQKSFQNDMMLAVTVSVQKRRLPPWSTVNYKRVNGGLMKTKRMIEKSDCSFPPGFDLQSSAGKVFISQVNSIVLAMSSKRLSMEYISVYSNKDASSHSQKMGLVVFRVHNIKKDNFLHRKFLRHLEEYNGMVGKYKKVYLTKEEKIEAKMASKKKTERKTYTIKPRVIYTGQKAAYNIAKDLGLYEYDVESFEELPRAKRAWVTIKSKQSGLNPDFIIHKIDRYIQTH